MGGKYVECSICGKSILAQYEVDICDVCYKNIKSFPKNPYRLTPQQRIDNYRPFRPANADLMTETAYDKAQMDMLKIGFIIDPLKLTQEK